MGLSIALAAPVGLADCPAGRVGGADPERDESGDAGQPRMADRDPESAVRSCRHGGPLPGVAVIDRVLDGQVGDGRVRPARRSGHRR
jgi:hypothetical protein